MTAAASPKTARRTQGKTASLDRGFTLIELLVVVAIIGILATIAMPAYDDYVTRGRIPDATANLANKRAQLELFYDNHHTYAGGISDCGTTDSTTSRFFSFSAACDTGTYVITATGVGSMAGFAFTIDEANNKVTTSVPSGWTANSSCWITKKGGIC